MKQLELAARAGIQNRLKSLEVIRRQAVQDDKTSLRNWLIDNEGVASRPVVEAVRLRLKNLESGLWDDV